MPDHYLESDQVERPSEDDARETLRRFDERLKVLHDVVAKQAEDLDRLRRFAPPIAERRARLNRLIYEITGLAIVATGAALVYSPAAYIVVGGWMLAEVLAARRRKKG